MDPSVQQPISTDNVILPSPISTSEPQNNAATSQFKPNIVSADDIGRKSSNPRGKIIATLLGLVLLIFGVSTGVVLVQRQQRLGSKAWACQTYNFLVSQTGVVSVINSSPTRTEPAQDADVLINGIKVATLSAPISNPGQTIVLGTVTVPANGAFTWQVIGLGNCTNSGTYEINTPTPTPVVTPTGTPAPTCVPRPVCLDNNPPCEPLEPVAGWCATPTPTPSPTPTPGTVASCGAVKAYRVVGDITDASSWNLMTSTDLTKLKSGDVVYFTIYGTSSGSTFDMARFRPTVNGVTATSWTESKDKRPGSDEFYMKYTIESGGTNYTINAQVHVQGGDWI